MGYLTSNRAEPCKDDIGGVKEMYLAKFQPYNRNRIILNEDKTELLTFPDTLVRLAVLRPDGNTYNESYTGEHWNQTVTVVLPKQDLETTRKMEVILSTEFRVILRMNNGLLKIFGLENGMIAENMTIDNGGARSSLNGYTFSLNGMERIKAPFLESLESVGFEVGEGDDSYDFQDEEEYTFQDNVIYDFQ